MGGVVVVRYSQASPAETTPGRKPLARGGAAYIPSGRAHGSPDDAVLESRREVLALREAASGRVARDHRWSEVAIQDFRSHLIEQLAFLDASASSYDSGHDSEAKRLATTIRLLVYHSGRSPSRSLLSHMGVRDRLPWTDTAAGRIREAVLTIGSGLCISELQLEGSGTAHFKAPLGDLPPERIHPSAAFVDWWNDPVLEDADGTDYSRGSLVLWVANKDGGAHVDAELPPGYLALTRENAIGLTSEPGDQPNSTVLGFGIQTSAGGLSRARVQGTPLENSLVLAHIRQIAWELRDTLSRHLVLDVATPFVRSPICPFSIHSSARPLPTGRCPCGSGRLFERCFGARRPRRSFSIRDLAAQADEGV